MLKDASIIQYLIMKFTIGDELKLIYLKKSQYEFKISWDLPEENNRITLPDEDHPCVVVVGWNNFPHNCSDKEITVAVKPLLSRFKCEKGYDWTNVFFQNQLKNVEFLDRNLAESLSDDGYWFQFVLDECIENVIIKEINLNCRYCSQITKTSDEGICYSCWRDEHFRKLGI